MESKEWKIYTKTGDKGETSLIGGTRVPKYHQRVEAYGTLDELNSYIGLIRDLINQPELSTELLSIETNLFIIESELATDPNVLILKTLPKITEEQIKVLEDAIDRINAILRPLQNFILPGGHPVSSHCHIARCICRRAERIIIQLATVEEVDSLALKYINRLSDYLFMLARLILHQNGISEIKWEPKSSEKK